jgi:hypothetical protein
MNEGGCFDSGQWKCCTDDSSLLSIPFISPWSPVCQHVCRLWDRTKQGADRACAGNPEPAWARLARIAPETGRVVPGDPAARCCASRRWRCCGGGDDDDDDVPDLVESFDVPDVPAGEKKEEEKAEEKKVGLEEMD